MGILRQSIQQIRAKLGVDPKLPDSAALTQALGREIAELNRTADDIRAVEQEIPLDVIRSDDERAATRRKLEELTSEHAARTRTCDLLRLEIADAIEREAIAEKISEFEAAAEKGRACSPLAKDLIAAILPAAAAARALLDANSAFVKVLPVKDAYFRNLWQLWRDERAPAGQVAHDVSQLIVLALEDPQRLEDEIGRGVETCTRNLAELRRGCPESAASKEKPQRGEKAA